MQEQLPIVRVQFFFFAFIDLATSEVSQLYGGAQNLKNASASCPADSIVIAKFTVFSSAKPRAFADRF